MMIQKAKNEFIFLSPFMALMAPFLVWPIELVFPFPYLVEEAAKAILAYFILQIPGKTRQIQFAILIGILFALSETVLYLFNLFQLNTLSYLFLRLILTSSLHATTMVTMVSVTFINKKLFPLGVVFAIIIHYIYNLLVTF